MIRAATITLNITQMVAEMQYKDGTEAIAGDVIRWKCWDSDDFTAWTFTGLYNGKDVVYLGGGIDFGNGIGKRFSVDDVEKDASNHDCSEQMGIEKIGTARELFLHISNFNKGNNK